MLATLANVVGAMAVLIALPLFFAGFMLAPLLVLAAGFAIFVLSVPD